MEFDARTERNDRECAVHGGLGALFDCRAMGQRVLSCEAGVEVMFVPLGLYGLGTLGVSFGLGSESMRGCCSLIIIWELRC